MKHLALGVCGLDCEDALLHLLNFVWPNILENSPHVINAVMEAIEGLITALGPGRIFVYITRIVSSCQKNSGCLLENLYTLYIFGQDALTPIYPKLEDDMIIIDVNTWSYLSNELQFSCN